MEFVTLPQENAIVCQNLRVTTVDPKSVPTIAMDTLEESVYQTESASVIMDLLDLVVNTKLVKVIAIRRDSVMTELVCASQDMKEKLVK